MDIDNDDELELCKLGSVRRSLCKVQGAPRVVKQRLSTFFEDG